MTRPEPYPEYHAAHSPWLDAFPAGWAMSRFGYEARLNGGQVDPREDPWVDMVLVAPNHIEGGTGRLLGRETAREQGADSGKYTVAAGQIVYSKIRPALNKAAVAAEDCLCSADMYAMSFRSRVDRSYALYQLLARPFHQFATVASSRVKMPKVNREELSEAPWLVPPLPEQHAIAKYLDRETAQIDALIGKQERLIETLRERRSAVVERTVFAGMDSTVDRSPNGYEWLPDESPSHWSLTQLGFRISTLAGYAFPSEGFSADSTQTRLLRGINVKPGRVDWRDTVYWDEDAAPVPPAFRLVEGDLVLGMDRPFVSGGVRIASVAASDLPALLLQRVMLLRCDAEGDRGYLARLVSTGAFLSYLEPLFTGVSVPHMSEWQVRKFKAPFPPLDEQHRIANYLDEQTAKIDALIVTAERFIEVSKERRSALITAAVTGQIDVRENVGAAGAQSTTTTPADQEAQPA